jgi:DNA-binding response OmpR family regulator
MTAVTARVTGDPPLPAPSRLPSAPTLTLLVRVDEASSATGRLLLAELARRLTALVAEIAPAATARSVVTATDRPDQRDLQQSVDHTLTSVPVTTTRTEAGWEGPVCDAPGSPVTTVVDTAAREITLHGRPVAVTFKEFGLLEYLMRRPHQAVTREELLHEVWRKRADAGTMRTVDVHVRRLRDKLGGCPQIVTVRGVGYRWDPAPHVVLVGSGDAG